MHSNVFDALHVRSGEVPAVLIVVDSLFFVAACQLLTNQLQHKLRLSVSKEHEVPAHATP